MEGFERETDVHVRSIIIKEVIDENGDRQLILEPVETTLWDALGLLDYATEVIKYHVRKEIERVHGD